VAPNSQALLLTNIGQLLTLRSTTFKATGPLRGPELNDVGLVEDAAVLCLDGKIAAAGKQSEVLRAAKGKKPVELDCAGKVVLPGFVDSHTHPIFAAPRLADFERRIAGASYEEIAAAGGGIRSSVDGVRKASVKELAARALAAFEEMSRQGTTTVEAKSGYGLSTEAELKSLEAIRAAAAEWPGTVVPTLLGAHVIPKECEGKPEKYIKEVCEKMIPQAAKKKLAVFVDVFVERGACSLADAERVFEAAAKYGLGVRAHVCQLSGMEIWPLLRFHPASLDHMDWAADEDLPQLARRDTVATLLPGANFFLGLDRYPPARRLIEAGVPVALATDYNPGSSPTASMPFVLSLACTQMKMTPAEAIAAATLNGAHALRLVDRKGSLAPGKDADLTLFDLDDYRELPYWVAAQRCAGTILKGCLVE
jgi:imidazolonepropionase